MGEREQREEGRLQWRKCSPGFGYMWQVHASSLHLIISGSSSVSDLTSTETTRTSKLAALSPSAAGERNPNFERIPFTLHFSSQLCSLGVRAQTRRRVRSRDSQGCVHTCVLVVAWRLRRVTRVINL